MPLEAAADLMADARRHGYAVGYFESWDLASLEGVIDAAEETGSPVIVGFNGEFLARPDRALPARLAWYGALARAAAESARVPCVVMFNECTAIDGNPNPVTAVATQDCIVWRVPANRFQSLVERYPQVGTGLLRMMAQRNRQLLARYEDLFSLPVLGRTAKILLDLSQWGQVSINRYKHSNQKMAALAATVPEAVSRSIKKFKEMDILDSDRTQITIMAPDRLADMTNVGSFWYDS